MECSGRSGRLVLFALASALPLLITSPALPQTTWFKYDGNPILDVGPPGSWEDRIVVPDRVIVQDSLFKMWYSGSSRTAGIGYATSRDGIRWKKYKRNPVLAGDPGSWESGDAYLPYVLTAGSFYRLWYSGGDVNRLRIGHARSRNGLEWRKDVGPVLRNGPSEWDSSGVGEASVSGPDSAGDFTMWFSGYDARWRSHIGYASAGDGTSWRKHEKPVLAPGSPGSWDDHRVQSPRVLRDGDRYEMWFGGNKGDYFASQIGYATSPDGILWVKHAYNPVLRRGPNGTWDDQSVHGRDVHFDGRMYFMWYGGYDGSVCRAGLAISPKDLTFLSSPSNGYVRPAADAVRFQVRVPHAEDLSFAVRIIVSGGAWKGPDETSVGFGSFRQAGFIELFDDGAHADSLAHDGVFANSWIPPEEQLYFANLSITLKGKDSLRFTMSNAGVFTSIGPVRYDRYEPLASGTPDPGDTVNIRLALRNQGASATAYSVTAFLSSSDPNVREITTLSAVPVDIGPGRVVVAGSQHRVIIDPECPPDADVQLRLSVSGYGIPLWTDSFSLRVGTPWWRRTWAYGLYAVCALALLYGVRRLEMKRVRARHRHEMDRFQTERLQELDRMKSRFFADISHEFRTPLTLIKGPVEQLLSGEFRGDTREQYRLIQKNCERLLGLVNQLLDLSKIEAGKMKLHRKELDVVEVVQAIVTSFESLATMKGIDLSISLPAGRVAGRFDKEAIEKIVTNLLSNAFRFTAEGGEVSVTVRKEMLPSGGRGEEHAVITIADTGSGIPADHLARIFDRFYQVDSAHTHDREGTGIGLALTKELVELHGGEIAVVSEVGIGTTFTVHLSIEGGTGGGGSEPGAVGMLLGEENERTPWNKRSQEEPLPERQGFPEGRTEDRSPEAGKMDPQAGLPILLVIDDNADMRRHIRSLLEESYRVLEAFDGTDGVRNAVESVPDLVISDVMMPGMDGFEVCRRLKTDERTCHVPVILLTARATAESKLEGLGLGADDYLVKPFDQKELLARTKNLIEGRRRLREKFGRAKILKPGDIMVESMDDAFLKKVLTVVERRLGEEEFSVEHLADEVAMSRSQLHRKLTALTDQAPRELIRSMRLHRAMDMLRQNAGTVSEVAFAVGFNSVTYFTKCFQEQFSTLPSDVRKEGV